MQGQRLERVNDLLHRVIAELLETRVRDPRKGFVTVTGVKTTADLKYATVTVSVLGDPEVTRESLKVLNHAKHFLRSELKREVELRLVPELRFVIDESMAKQARVQELLHEIAQIESARPPAPTDEESDVTGEPETPSDPSGATGAEGTGPRGGTTA